MKLEKAIEKLEGRFLVPRKPVDHQFQDALLLGIEALKRIMAWRNDNDDDFLWDLPGETED